MFSKVGPKF